MSTLSIKEAADRAIVPAFEAATGCKALIDWAPTTVLMPKLAAGAQADVVILVDEAMNELASKNMIDTTTRLHLVNSQVGLAVRQGAPHPDISDLDAFKRTLLQARSVAYSRGGASGIYFSTMLTDLGIADAVNAKATIIPAGFTAEKLLTEESDIAVQQISELLAVNGIEIVGRFPTPVRKVVSVSAAMLCHAENRSGAERFLAALTDRIAAKAYRDIGLDTATD